MERCFYCSLRGASVVVVFGESFRVLCCEDCAGRAATRAGAMWLLTEGGR